MNPEPAQHLGKLPSNYFCSHTSSQHAQLPAAALSPHLFSSAQEVSVISAAVSLPTPHTLKKLFPMSLLQGTIPLSSSFLLFFFSILCNVSNSFLIQAMVVFQDSFHWCHICIAGGYLSAHFCLLGSPIPLLPCVIPYKQLLSFHAYYTL